MKPIRTIRATLKDKVKPVTGEVHFRVYKQGKIIDSGTHKELLNSNKEYKKLCETEIIDV